MFILSLNSFMFSFQSSNVAEILSIPNFPRAFSPGIPKAKVNLEISIFLFNVTSKVFCNECKIAYSVSIKVPSISKTICLYVIISPIPIISKIVL